MLFPGVDAVRSNWIRDKQISNHGGTPFTWIPLPAEMKLSCLRINSTNSMYVLLWFVQSQLELISEKHSPRKGTLLVKISFMYNTVILYACFFFFFDVQEEKSIIQNRRQRKYHFEKNTYSVRDRALMKVWYPMKSMFIQTRLLVFFFFFFFVLNKHIMVLLTKTDSFFFSCFVSSTLKALARLTEAEETALATSID